MTVVESLAVETPVVISDLPDYDHEIFADGQTVVRVKPGDVSSLAGGLIRLARDTDLRRRLGNTGRQIAAARADYRIEMRRLETAYIHLVRPTA
jgi:glycosyltransferase involved in cell wall biosynthesis